MNKLPYILMPTLVFAAGCVWSANGLRSSGSQSAQVRTIENTLAVTGIWETKKTDSQIKTVSEDGVSFFTSQSNIAAVKGTLEQPLNGSGAVALWFKTAETLRSSFSQQSISQTFLTIGGLCKIGFYGKDPGDNCPSIYLKWDKNIANVRDIAALLPEIPASSTIHIAFAWDSEKGLANAYINGTPLKPIDTTSPWQMNEYRDITVYAGPLPVTDVRIYDNYLTAAQVRGIMNGRHIGILDKYLGLTELGRLDDKYIESIKGELFYSNPLEKPSDIEGWKMEGPGAVDFGGGYMKMQSLMADKGTDFQGHIVNWCDVDMPENFIASWDYRLESKYGLTILFFCAKGVTGQDIFSPQLAPRDGTFSTYIKGDINNYHISYQANGPDGGSRRTSHIRKNSGFALASNGPVGIERPSKTMHKAMLIKNGSHIQMAIDGRLIIDFVEDGSLGDAHGSGKMGFRQMKWTVAAYKNLQVYTIKNQ